VLRVRDPVLAERVALPMAEPELKKVTVPVGVAGPGGFAGETVAVRATGEPAVAACELTVRADLLGRASTVSVQFAELGKKAPVGVYSALIVCVPAMEPV
jgi:hypothetical protein